MVIAVIVVAVIALAEFAIIWQLISRLLVQAKLQGLTLAPAKAAQPSEQLEPRLRPKFAIKVPS